MPKEAFSRALGRKWGEIIAAAGSSTRQLDDPDGALYDSLAKLLNARIGELMGLRIELERREAKSRRKRIGDRLKQEARNDRR